MTDLMNTVSQLISELSARDRALLATALAARPEPIAIVGIGCRFPGGAVDPDSFWRLLAGGVDAVGEVPRDRWDVDAYYDPDPDAAGKCYTRYGGFLERVDGFDPHFFDILPREAAHMDPQQRLLLEVAWEALEDAALSPEALRGKRAGVFVGGCSHDYAELQTRSRSLVDVDSHTLTGDLASVLAGRLSYVLGLTGPSFTVDTACSSSLVALHLAAESLRRGECDMALAGGVNVILSPDGYVKLSRMRALSADGRCRSFDSRASGYARGEGAALLALKRLGDAEQAGDRIWAVVRGSAVNHDGRSAGLTAPNGLAQRDVILAALERAGVTPAEVGLIEAHGTGTPLGDPIELETLTEVYGRPRADGSRCAVGSVKTNIGHLEAAAGVAGVVKAVLAMRHAEVPAHLHFTQLNPRLSLDGTALTIPTAARPWAAGAQPRVAGVSSFGISGTNAHVILGEAPPRPPAAAAPPSPTVLTLSAKSAGALTELSRRYAAALAGGAPSLADVAATANGGRARFAHRLALVASTSGEAAAALAAFAAGAPPAGELLTGVAAARPRIAFVFPARFDGALAAAAEALAAEPPFARALQEVEAALRRFTATPLTRMWTSDDGDDARCGRFAFAVALTALWRAWGVVPEWLLGDGVGALAAAHAAGVLTLDEAARLAHGSGGAPTIGAARAGLVSATTGRRLDAAALADAQTWSRRDGDAASLRAGLTTLAEAGVELLVEIGLGDALTRLARTTLPATIAGLPSLDGRSEPARSLARALATLETHGAAIDWAGYHRQRPGRRIGLPTYPFARERHWLPAPASRPTPSAATARPPAADGLDRRRPSLLAGLQYEATLRLDTLPLPAPPRDGRVVLPAALQLARLVTVGSDALASPALLAEELLLAEPLLLRGADDERRVLTALVPAGEGDFALTMASVATADAPTVAPTRHLSARLRAAPATVAATRREAPLAGGLDGDAFYQRLAALGVAPFGGLRAVTQARLDEGESAGAATLTPPAGAPLPFALLHAALELALASAPPPAAGLAPLLLGAHRLGWFGATAGDASFGCVARAFAGAPGEPTTLDVRIVDGKRRLVAELVGLRLDWRRSAEPAAEAAAPESVARLVRRVQWSARPLPSGATSEPRRWLIVGSDLPAAALVDALAARGQTAEVAAPDGWPAALAAGWDHVVDLRADATADAAATTRAALALLQALAAQPRSPRLWLTTRAAHVCLAGDDARGHGGAPLWGLMRTVAVERPALYGGLVDLPLEWWADESELLADHLLAGDAREAALRDGLRLTPRLAPAPESLSPRPLAPRADATYVVTGGLGGLGLAWARWLVDHGARHLVLVGRSAASTAAQAALTALTAAGATVRLVQADVARAADVASLLRAIDDGLPPLAGLIHAAGVAADAPLAAVDDAALAHAFAAKVDGSRRLAAALDGRALDFVVFVSSIAALLGNPGQAAYAAANAFVDGLASHLRARGLPALSLALGPVAGVGLARDLPAGTRHRWGIGDLPFADALAAFARLAGGDVATAALVDVDEARLAAEPGPPPALLAGDEPPAMAAGPARLARLRALAPAERQPALQAEVESVTRSILGFDPAFSLDPQQRLDELGLDSLLAIDLVRGLDHAFGTTLPSTLLMDFPTVAALAGYLGETLLAD